MAIKEHGRQAPGRKSRSRKVPKSQLVQISIERVPQELKEAILNEAEKQQMTVRDVVTQAFAQAFKVPFEPNGRTYPRGEAGVGTITLKVPVALRVAINTAAARKDVKRNEFNLAFLHDYFIANKRPGR